MLVPGELLTEGKGKRIYATEDPDKAIVYFKDEAMAYHGLKRANISSNCWQPTGWKIILFSSWTPASPW